MLNERPKPVYEVKTASRRVERQLDKVDNEIYPKVAKAIESLANNPRPFGVKKLAGRVHRIRGRALPHHLQHLRPREGGGHRQGRSEERTHLQVTLTHRQNQGFFHDRIPLVAHRRHAGTFRGPPGGGCERLRPVAGDGSCGRGWGRAGAAEAAGGLEYDSEYFDRLSTGFLPLIRFILNSL